ncbi:terminase large subunit domain-containing protein [Sphingosinicella sp.]|uniref:terminase large subunit domain-containing protein n=1 Tax=Sphingosinicella sp. TaxID=1917971 RepID=UPI0040381732
MSSRKARAVLEAWGGMAPEGRRELLAALPSGVTRGIEDKWWAHGGQIEPPGDWRIWAIVAGRGFGKTRAGAEWVWARAREYPAARIALVAASLDEVAKVMVEGESGLLACTRTGEEPRWIPSRGTFEFPSGALGFAHTAAKPAKLRGFQHHFAWCDELAKWTEPDETWHNLMLGLRLGERPRTIVTTTPQPVPLLKVILALDRCAATHGRTDENPHLPHDFREAVEAMYGGTRLGRQELEGVLFEDFEGALWTREMIERARVRIPLPGREGLGVGATEGSLNAMAWSPSAASSRLGADPPLSPPLEGGEFHLQRIVVGLDPPASTGGDACGIVVCGADEAGLLHVLADLSARGLSPEAWARRVAAAAEEWGASLVVAEKNQGGDMIASVLRGVDACLPVRLVPATKSKPARAEPVALRFETGKARLAGSFPELEDQLCALTWDGYRGQGSPDRLDAMVWAMTELIKPRREPRIVGF